MNNKKSKMVLGLILVITSLFASFQFVYAAEYKRIINAKVSVKTPTADYTYEEIEIVGDYAFTATIGREPVADGLRVLDVSDASSIAVLPAIGETTNSSYSIDVYDDVAYLRVRYALGVWGIEAFNITDPTSPVEQGDFSAYDDVSDYRVIDDVLYVCNDTYLCSINVTDLDSISELDRIELSEHGSVAGVYDDYVFVSGYVGAAGTTRTLEIVDASDPTSLFVSGTLEVGDYFVSNVLVEGDTLYASGRDYDLASPHGGTVKTVDISDTSNPSVLDTIVTDGISATGLYISGNTLYTGACARGAVSIDVSTPSDLKPIGYWNEYQLDCGGEYYAQHPTYKNDATYGEVLYFVSINCGIAVMSIDSIEFEQDIPGPMPALILVFSACTIFLLSRKGLKFKIER